MIRLSLNSFGMKTNDHREGEQTDMDDQFPEEMFRFEKIMKGADRI